MQYRTGICFIILRNRQFGVYIKPRKESRILINFPEKERFGYFLQEAAPISPKKFYCDISMLGL